MQDVRNMNVSNGSRFLEIDFRVSNFDFKVQKIEYAPSNEVPLEMSTLTLDYIDLEIDLM